MIALHMLHFGFIVALAKELKVPYLELHDANLIPALAFGTGGSISAPDERVRDIRLAVTLAIQVGYRHIDTAAIYGTEEEVGLGIRDAFDLHIITKRKQLFVTTKLWNNRHGRHQVVPALRESLAKLGLDYVDLYLIHTPIAVKDNSDPDTIDYLETWEGMREAKALGLTLSIGVANFNKTQIYRLALFTSDIPAVNQIEVSPTNSEEELVALCQSLGIVVMGTNAFGYLWPNSNQLLDELAISLGKTQRQLLLRYLVERGIIPVTRTTDPNEVKEFIDIFDFKISLAMHSFKEFNADKRVVTMAAFRNYPNYPFKLITYT